MMRVILLTLLFVLLALIPPKVNAQLVSVPIPGSGLYINVMTNPQTLQYLNSNPSATNVTMGDDSVVNVPLPFTFPFYGQNFTDSWMYSNGAVSFKSGSASGGFCCSGQPLTTSLNSSYNYSILPLWTDLIASGSNSSHYKLGTSNSMTYGWYNVNQYGTNNKSSFEVKVDSTGGVDIRTSGMFVSTSAAVTVGTVGDASKGEFTQLYYGQGINIGATQAYGIFNIDSCSSNPLSSANCAGYAAAYLTQQCAITSLYSSSCPGYAAAYLTQQCSLSALYSSSCPGYEAAYFTQQCNLSGLYDQKCPNYSTAYATSQVLTTMTTSTTTSTTVSTTTPSISVSSSGTVSTSVPLVSDSNVNSVITSTTTSAAPSATAAVPLVSTPTTQPQGVQSVSAQTSTQASASTTRQETTQTGNTRTTEAKTEAKTTSQQMKDSATAKAKEEMKKAETAATMEAQIATQGAVVSLMSFVPGFDGYQTAKLFDVNGLKLQSQYGKDVVENRFVNRRLFGGTDRLHREMVDQQYQLGR